MSERCAGAGPWRVWKRTKHGRSFRWVMFVMATRRRAPYTLPRILLVVSIWTAPLDSRAGTCPPPTPLTALLVLLTRQPPARMQIPGRHEPLHAARRAVVEHLVLRHQRLLGGVHKLHALPRVGSLDLEPPIKQHQPRNRDPDHDNAQRQWKRPRITRCLQHCANDHQRDAKRDQPDRDRQSSTGAKPVLQHERALPLLVRVAHLAQRGIALRQDWGWCPDGSGAAAAPRSHMRMTGFHIVSISAPGA
mmetsp:Transcript_15260/g.48715  ORF Transcript_15260/g.48715 Transcript_15260/m.48715 type:complete len:248 (+) Transcript_15260:360-1103(+)